MVNTPNWMASGAVHLMGNLAPEGKAPATPMGHWLPTINPPFLFPLVLLLDPVGPDHWTRPRYTPRVIRTHEDMCHESAGKEVTNLFPTILRGP
jgi:hypothetical protein